MIIVGGFNTYPAEIENFYPAPSQACSTYPIVGVPDPVMGEAVMAFVIPKAGHDLLTDEEVAAFARGNRSPTSKCRSYVEIVEQLSADGIGEGAEVQAEGLRGREVRPEGAHLAAAGRAGYSRAYGPLSAACASAPS